jgi:hypothetical protein
VSPLKGDGGHSALQSQLVFAVTSARSKSQIHISHFLSAMDLWIIHVCLKSGRTSTWRAVVPSMT